MHFHIWKTFILFFMDDSIVVVDDDTDILDVFTEFLKIKGFNIAGTGVNGKEAVELYKKHSPTVILLDVMMPEYDGIYALYHIRQIDPDAVIIMVTADLSSDTQKKLKEYNASAVINKPYDIDVVVDTINKIINN